MPEFPSAQSVQQQRDHSADERGHHKNCCSAPYKYSPYFVNVKASSVARDATDLVTTRLRKIKH